MAYRVLGSLSEADDAIAETGTPAEEREGTETGIRHTLDLVCPGGGHTESDAYLYLPDESILFAGDLVAVQFHPVIGHSAPEWLTILDPLDALPIVADRTGPWPPGHRG